MLFIPHTLDLTEGAALPDGTRVFDAEAPLSGEFGGLDFGDHAGDGTVITAVRVGAASLLGAPLGVDDFLARQRAGEFDAQRVDAGVHLPTPQMYDQAKGFFRSERPLAEFGRMIISTDPKHNETWVWLE